MPRQMDFASPKHLPPAQVAAAKFVSAWKRLYADPRATYEACKAGDFSTCIYAAATVPLAIIVLLAAAIILVLVAKLFPSFFATAASEQSPRDKELGPASSKPIATRPGKKKALTKAEAKAALKAAHPELDSCSSSTEEEELTEEEKRYWDKVNEVLAEYQLSKFAMVAARKWVKEMGTDGERGNSLERVRVWFFHKMDGRRRSPPQSQWQRGCPEIIPRVRALPFWSALELPWLAQLAARADVVKEELFKLRGQGVFQPYRAPNWAGGKAAKDGVGKTSHDRGSWNVYYLLPQSQPTLFAGSTTSIIALCPRSCARTIDLTRFGLRRVFALRSLIHAGRTHRYYLQLHDAGEFTDENSRRCPQTVALLRDVLPKNRDYGHCFFSALSPGTHITKHHGPTNKKLRLHLPLCGTDDSRYSELPVSSFRRTTAPASVPKLLPHAKRCVAVAGAGCE